MPFVYCDHNFVITAHDESEEYKKSLRALGASSSATFVLSPWHWQEMAQDKNHERGVSVADFSDSLNSSWLYERIAIQRKEVTYSFCNFVGISVKAPVMVGGVRDVFHDLAGKWVDRASRSVVAHLRNGSLIKETLSKEYENNQKNIANFKAGNATPQLMKAVERKYVELLLPKSDAIWCSDRQEHEMAVLGCF
jgi:hypothetical protein